MKISVAVASFNYGRYLDACLGSLAAQTYGDFEVLIADGGSKDDSLRIIEGYCERDSRFRLVSTEDRGQADAIVKALALASGEIHGFLNADDVLIARDAFESIVQAFEAYPACSVISFIAWYVDKAGQHLKPVRHRYHPADDISMIRRRNQVVQPATYWKREVSREIPFRPDFHFVFDSVFFYEAYLRFSYLELPKPIAGYRLHEENKSLTTRSVRVRELAEFERLKFGRGSLRGSYLGGIAWLVEILERAPVLGVPLRRVLRVGVNALALLSAYRLPGI